MNCDQVFEVLTRGPFPTGGTSDAPVERHLRACHDCRNLAEALRPAVNLFHETLAQEESAELPGYNGGIGDVPSENLALAVDRMLRQTVPSVKRHALWSTPRRRPFGSKRNVLAAVTVVFLIASTLVLAIVQRERSRIRLARQSYHPWTTIDADAVRRATAQLNQLGLPDRCRQKTAAASPAGQDCCTRCHFLGSPRAPQSKPKTIELMLAACGICHGPPPAEASASARSPIPVGVAAQFFAGR